MDKDTLKMKADLELLSNPDKWPAWPFVPVKRRSNQVPNKDLGFIVHTEQHPSPVIVWHGYHFAIPEAGIASLPCSEYPNLQALLEDDWMVD